MDNIEFLEIYNGRKVSIMINGLKGIESYVGELLFLNENTIGLSFETYKNKTSKKFIDKIFIDKSILTSIWIY